MRFQEIAIAKHKLQFSFLKYVHADMTLHESRETKKLEEPGRTSIMVSGVAGIILTPQPHVCSNICHLHQRWIVPLQDLMSSLRMKLVACLSPIIRLYCTRINTFCNCSVGRNINICYFHFVSSSYLFDFLPLIYRYSLRRPSPLTFTNVARRTFV